MTDKNKNPMHLNGIPEKAAQIATEHNREKVKEMEEADKKANQANSPASDGGDVEQQYSLNDDRRVKVLSPGALVYKRFIRNRLAVTGLTALLIMFIFSFLGGVVSPYGEKEQFFVTKSSPFEIAGFNELKDFEKNSFCTNDPETLPEKANSYVNQAARKAKDSGLDKVSFNYKGKAFEVRRVGDNEDFYEVYSKDKLCGMTAIDRVDALDASVDGADFNFRYPVLKAMEGGEKTFTWNGRTFTVTEEGGVLEGDNEVASLTRFLLNPLYPDIEFTKEVKFNLYEAMPEVERDGDASFEITEEDGSVTVYSIEYNALHETYTILKDRPQQYFDTYGAPSKAHWLGTDGHAMDMLTRLMYGGRVSLLIGFIVVFIESFIGVIFGGISGYFGGWVDNLMMRIVDVFYCIPSTPLLIILGAIMDAKNVDPSLRMLYLMLILGFLGWPGVARLVRGQILSLREQEFMTATEAGGIRVSRRIFRHLIPNVIPQLIVAMTMGLGGTIIIEATLSFLGLGVRFPFASWGNIINDVNNTFVLTTYLFIWIPAGVCLLATVLAFNLVGDGLRDAFDPKMKR